MFRKKNKRTTGKRGYTQERLAEIAEIEPRSLSKIECGVTFPSKSLASIADSLEISLPHLFEFNHIEKTVDTMKDDIRNNFDKFNSEQIKVVYRLLLSMYQ